MRILIADDQPNVRYALQVLFSGRPDFLLTGEAADAYELQDFLPIAHADMLIIDWMLPGLSEIGSLAALRTLSPGLVIIALSGRPELGRKAIEAGADAFVSKIDPPERLLNTIDRFNNQAEIYAPS